MCAYILYIIFWDLMHFIPVLHVFVHMQTITSGSVAMIQ